MFDNLRDSSSSPFYEEEPNELYKEPAVKSVAAPTRRNNSRFLGMTAQQRFIISLMLMFMVCVMGTLAMLVLEKMSFY